MTAGEKNEIKIAKTTVFKIMLNPQFPPSSPPPPRYFSGEEASFEVRRHNVSQRSSSFESSNALPRAVFTLSL